MTNRPPLAMALLFALLALPGCGPAEVSAEVSGRDGFKDLLRRIIEKPDDRIVTGKRMCPTKADCEQLFDAAAAGPMYEHCTKAVNSSIVGPKDSKTGHQLTELTTEILQGMAANSTNFPGGNPKMAPHLKPKVTWFVVKFEGNESPHHDGFAFVNGHWRWFPPTWPEIR